MKQYFKISAIAFFIGITLLGWQQKAVAQKPDTYKMVSEKIANKDFVFVANSLTPMTGKQRILTSEYDVTIKKDSIVSYLPYFGRAQAGYTSSEDAGIMFTATKFDYTYEAGKKKSWNLVIKFKDQKNTQEFSFIIYSDGNASLNVTSMLRDPISFRGYIKM